MTFSRFILSFSVVLPLLAAGCGPGSSSPSSASAGSALTSDECIAHEVDGKVWICHATSSAKHPYNLIDVSVDGCLHGHAGHPRDLVANADGTCGGEQCRSQGESCGNGHTCCGGLTCTEGVCTAPDPCAGCTIGANDPECATAVCNRETGACNVQFLEASCHESAGVCAQGACSIPGDRCAGKTCTVGEHDPQCNTASCVSATGECIVVRTEDGTTCNEGAGACAQGICVPQNSCSLQSCNIGGMDPECASAACNAETGECDMQVNDGGSCHDGAGTCVDGNCFVRQHLCDNVTCSIENNHPDCATASCIPENGQCVIHLQDDGAECRTESGLTGSCDQGACAPRGM